VSSNTNMPNWTQLKQVLLLEDDLDLCEVIKIVIEMDPQYRVTVVHRGVEGVHEVMARKFDAIVCDMLMPGMAGDMFYLAVQRIDPTLCSRFVFITAAGSDPHIARFIQQVNGTVLHKPLHTNELMNAIAAVVPAPAVQLI
jgi:two-component system NtrC family sensor kinase